MSISVGEKSAVLYRGAYRPAALYRGEHRIAGWRERTEYAPVRFAHTYSDTVKATAYGRGRQTTSRGVNLLPFPDLQFAEAGYPVSLVKSNYSALMAAANQLPRGTELVVSGMYESTSNTSVNRQIRFVGADGTVLGKFTINGASSQIAEGEICTIYIYFGSGKPSASLQHVQIEAGTTPTAYEPYTGGQVLPRPDSPQEITASSGGVQSANADGTRSSSVTLPALRAIPGTDISDTAEYIGSGQWKITRRIGTRVLDGSEAWSYFVAAYGRAGVVIPDMKSAAAGRGKGACSIAPLGTFWNAAGIHAYFGAGNQIFYLFLGEDLAPTAEDFRRRLAALAEDGTPCTIWYELDTPKTETVTLGTLSSYPGNTVLTVAGDFTPDAAVTVRVSDTLAN
mgnify:CR=1 FL=1